MVRNRFFFFSLARLARCFQHRGAISPQNVRNLRDKKKKIFLFVLTRKFFCLSLCKQKEKKKTRLRRKGGLFLAMSQPQIEMVKDNEKIDLLYMKKDALSQETIQLLNGSSLLSRVTLQDILETSRPDLKQVQIKQWPAAIWYKE